MTVKLTAVEAYRAMNGVFCAHKDFGRLLPSLVKKMGARLVEGINALEQRPIRNRVVYHEENWGTKLPLATLVPDLSDHINVVGPRFIDEDFQIHCADEPEYVVKVAKVKDYELTINQFNVVFGINECPELWDFVEARHMRVYHVRGKFGKATDDFTVNGRTLEKTTFGHIDRYDLERSLAAIQAGHQKYMYQIAGVDLQSQEAYELASKGLLRARVGESANQLIYSIKCIDFSRPFFTLELHCVNESAADIGRLVHKIGIELRSTASMAQCHRIRWGNFTPAHAISNPASCSVARLLANIELCRPLMSDDRLVTSGNIVEMEPLPLVRDGSLESSSDKLLESGHLSERGKLGNSSAKLLESASLNKDQRQFDKDSGTGN